MATKPKTALTAASRTALWVLGMVLYLWTASWGGQESNPGSARRSRTSPTTRSSRSRQPQGIVRVVLPAAKTTSSISFEQALTDQAEPIPMDPSPLDNTQLGQLAWAAQIQTDPMVIAQTLDRRTPFTADPRRAMQLHFVTHTGVYVYQPAEHQMEQTSVLDRRQELVLSTVDLLAAGNVGAAVIISGPSRGTNARATNQIKRGVLLETGRIVQNLRLQAATQQLTTASLESFNTETVGRLIDLPRNLEAQYILFIGRRGTKSTKDNSTLPTDLPRTKRVVLVVPPARFNDAELFEMQRVLGLAGVETVVASTHRGLVSGSLGQVTQATIEIKNVNPRQVDAVVFIGGPGLASLVNNTTAHQLAQRTLRQQKWLGATGTAPTLLAQAGLLQGVSVTAAATEHNILQAAGAQVTGTAIQRQNLILTARGPDGITLFASTLVNLMAGN